MKTHTLQEYFYYTRLERNAGIVLCFLCILVYGLPLCFPFFVPPATQVDFAAAQQVAANLAEGMPPENAADRPIAFRNAGDEPPRQVETFAFDPNTASKADLVRLGLSPRTAQTILNYRAKGGQFYKKEDLKRMYTIRAADYERLAAYVQIPPKAGSGKYEDFSKKPPSQGFGGAPIYEQRPSYTSNFPKKNSTTTVDINTASLEDWQQIRGVGPGWAKRIVNFREKLGGFATPEQVGQTFGLPDSVFQKMLPQLQASTPVFRRIKINAATMDELNNHPYLSRYQATILFNYRLQHGNYSDFESLKKVRAGFTEADWKRLEPYFTFEF